MSGLAADGCTDSTCDTGVTIAWLVLLASQAILLVTGAVVCSRYRSRTRLGVMALLAVVSPLTIAAYISYVDRYF